MNIDKLVRKAIIEIKLKWGLPDKGFIAGGSIANLVWKYCSGEKAKVNDIDVFLKSETEKEFVFQFVTKEYKYSETYRHLQQQLLTKNKYKIFSVLRDGMLNIIKVSDDATPLSILQSFDINATCVGYSIEEDKVYFLDSFVEFLKTGELKIVNIMTPAHTAIRLIKKKDDLNAKLDEFELRLVQFCLANRYTADHLQDFDRFRFQDKYAKMFTKYQDELGKYFELKNCTFLEAWISDAHNKEVKLYELKNIDSPELEEFKTKAQSVFPEKFLITTNDLLFYFRNISGDEKREKTWTLLAPLFKREDYLDDCTQQQIEFLEKFIRIYPRCMDNLAEYKLHEQYKLVNDIINKIGEQFDIETAAKVLELNKLSPNQEIDDFEVMILGLKANRTIKKKYKIYEEELPF